MNIMNKVTIRNLKLNKKRTIGTIIGITLSVALICCVSLMFASLRKTFISAEKMDMGDYHIYTKNITQDELNTIKNNRVVSNLNILYVLGYTKRDNIISNKIISINDENVYSNMNNPIDKGRLPKNSDEIIVSDQETDYKIGDTITLNIGDIDVHKEGEQLNITNTREKQYRVVGVYSTNYSIKSEYGEPMFTTGTKSNNIDVYLRINNPMKYDVEIPKVLGVSNMNELDNSKYYFEINDSLLRWEGFKFGDVTTRAFTMLFMIVVGIIIFTSVFCIRNAFAISTTEKIKVFSMLSSVGATKKQIKKSVIKEGFYLGLIGIPCGLLLGFIATGILVFTINFLLADFVIGDFKFKMDVPVIALILSIILGYITIYLSSLASSVKASKVSPIEGLRNSNEIKIKNKKLKTPKYIDKLFGIGGVIAYKNLKRSQKKYRTTVISLVVSILTFISMNSFIKYGFSFAGDYYKNIDYNVEVSLINTNMKYSKLVEENKLKDYTIHYYYRDGIEVDCNNLTDFIKEEILCDNGKYVISVYALDDASFKNYAKNNNLNYDKVKEGAIIYNEASKYERGRTIHGKYFKYKKNDIVSDLKTSLKVEALTNKNIRGFELTHQDAYFVIDYEFHKDMKLDESALYIKSSDPDKLETILSDKYHENVEIFNLDKEVRAMNSIVLLISIFLYGFITVITLIGITNIFNTITSNIELRQKEFATLKSIGMTNKEFNKMINLETLFYSIKSLFFGIILGNIDSYLIYKAIAERTDFGYSVPFIPIILSIIFVFILVFTIMKFSVKKVNKQNIIETIRKENI